MNRRHVHTSHRHTHGLSHIKRLRPMTGTRPHHQLNSIHISQRRLPTNRRNTVTSNRQLLIPTRKSNRRFNSHSHQSHRHRLSHLVTLRRKSGAQHRPLITIRRVSSQHAISRRTHTQQRHHCQSRSSQEQPVISTKSIPRDPQPLPSEREVSTNHHGKATSANAETTANAPHHSVAII